MATPTISDDGCFSVGSSSVPMMSFWSPRSSASSDIDYVDDAQASTPTDSTIDDVVPTSDAVLHHGWLFKRGQGGFFHRASWKARFCVVTSASLRYYSRENETKKGELDLTGCTHKSVEVLPRKALRSSHPTLWRFAVHTPKRRMVFSASSETEMNDWIRSIHMALALQKNNFQVVQQVQMADRRTAPIMYISQRDGLRPTCASARGYSSMGRPPRRDPEVEF
ncbi:hypothetical protein SPRG_10273 [Saprolegnia parasitica CBS 223.65]|uniref:PH domain-containing protein n=1 Tax=Saprolegnia parasitica (strain CBS 223.65) TaxID=695850 RepID=A0A067C1V9_SAPPC|nr:hypothetical protein SPRG_10273 [Saprolegnia parasitica CBS 223.65]KDO24739.1 hypothetical protein SPRG_10273 [Saprolegnia parasitica CBS 223.65]|eukprot:XP_012204619.1 hypothetical protein SPRG_10273 [Saprolegnia parasitica CBS 223.65]